MCFHVLSYLCSPLICVLSYACSRMCAFLSALICVLLLCSHMLSSLCSHVCALLCVFSLCSHICALVCVFSSVCSHVCALLCALTCVLSSVPSYVCSHDAVSLSQFQPQHCLGSLGSIIPIICCFLTYLVTTCHDNIFCGRNGTTGRTRLEQFGTVWNDLE